MPILDFLNETSLQDYPLQPRQTFGLTLDNSWFADANFVLGVATTYDYGTDGALTQIVGAVGDVTFTFTIGGVAFSFVVPRSAAPGYTASANGRIGVTTSNKYGFGYLQIGNISTIGTGTWTGSAKVEPTTIITLAGHQVNTINLANTLPTTITEKCVQYYASGTVDGNVAYFNNGSTIPAGNYHLQYAGGAMRYGSTTRFKWDVGIGSANWQFTNASSSSLMNLPFMIQSSGWRSQTECEADQAIARSSNTSAVSLAGGIYGIKLVDFPYTDNFSGMPNPTWELVPVLSSSSSSSDDGIAIATSIKTDIIGDVMLIPGGHSTITLDTTANTVNFGFTDEAEEGGELPCDNISLIYGSSLTGPKCKDLLYTVDGVGPNPDNNTFNLAGSRGIAVVPLVDGHGLRVELSPLILFKDQSEPDCVSSSGMACDLIDGFSSSPVILGTPPTGSLTSTWSSWVPSSHSSSSNIPTTGGWNPYGNWKINYFSPMVVGRDCYVEGGLTHSLTEATSTYVRDAFLNRISGSIHGICPSACSTYGTFASSAFKVQTFQDTVYRSGVIVRIGFNAGYGCVRTINNYDDAIWEGRALQFIENSYDALLPSSSYWRRNQEIDGVTTWFGSDSSGGPGIFLPGTYLLRYERGAYSRGPNPANGHLEFCTAGYEIIVRGVNGSDFVYGPAPYNLNEPYYGWSSSDTIEQVNVGLAERVENLVPGPIGMRLKRDIAQGTQLAPAPFSSTGFMQTPRFILYKAQDYPGTNEP
jgi:hypothetical protein